MPNYIKINQRGFIPVLKMDAPEGTIIVSESVLDLLQSNDIDFTYVSETDLISGEETLKTKRILKVEKEERDMRKPTFIKTRTGLVEVPERTFNRRFDVPSVERPGVTKRRRELMEVLTNSKQYKKIEMNNELLEQEIREELDNSKVKNLDKLTASDEVKAVLPQDEIIPQPVEGIDYLKNRTARKTGEKLEVVYDEKEMSSFLEKVSSKSPALDKDATELIENYELEPEIQVTEEDDNAISEMVKKLSENNTEEDVFKVVSTEPRPVSEDTMLSMTRQQLKDVLDEHGIKYRVADKLDELRERVREII